MANKPKMKELLKHIKALEYWVRISDGKASNLIMKQVAENSGVHMRTAKRWYSEFEWKKRYDEKVLEVARREAEITTDILLTTREEYRRIIARLVQIFKENIGYNKVRMTLVSDFEKVVKLDLNLQGIATGDETQINIITAIPRPIATELESITMDESSLTVIPDQENLN